MAFQSFVLLFLCPQGITNSDFIPAFSFNSSEVVLKLYILESLGAGALLNADAQFVPHTN